MSWIKRRGQPSPSPNTLPPVQMYNPNQHSIQENQWQHQSQNNWYNQQDYQPKQEPHTPPQTNYWSQPYANTPQQSTAYTQNAQPHYGQFHDQQASFQNNAGYQPQAYGNLQYNQQYSQNNVYATQQQSEVKTEGDAWNWGWGDEDNSNVQATQGAVTANSSQGQNNVADSFGTDESWNWSVEQPKMTGSQDPYVPKTESKTETHEDSHPKVAKPVNRVPLKPEPFEETNNPASRPDNLNIIRRAKLETPQWSVESQASQESSDDILQTSESDKSHIVSRSSTISHSPVLTQEQPLSAPAEFADYSLEGARRQFENREVVSKVKHETAEAEQVKSNAIVGFPKNTHTPPLLPPARTPDDSKNPYKRTLGLTHKNSNSLLQKSSVEPRQSDFGSAKFSNHNVNLETLPDNSEQPDPIPSLSAQLVRKVSASKHVQQWPENNEAPMNDRNQYLETGQLSDLNLDQSSERSNQQDTNDTLPPPGLRRMVLGQMEQSENSVNPNSYSDEPPPGLSRMVLGQTESASNTASSALQMEDDLRNQYDSTEPPEGLRRMVPGESSSPESTLRHQQTRRQDDSDSEFNQLTSHAPEPRSATIGADTPPIIPNPITTQSSGVQSNRSETIGGDTPPLSAAASGQDNLPKRGASHSSSSDNRGFTSDRHNRKLKDSKKQEQSTSNTESIRRDFIEGQTQDSEIAKLTNSVRNLAVGENLSDDHASNTSLPEINERLHSRQESTDSEREAKKPPRNSRDKRYPEKSRRDKDRERDKEHDRNRDRDRYTPESYRDKRYDKRRYKDRRYEEDTDCYSDKERRETREKDYERKYSSLRKDKDKERRKRDPREYGRDSRRGDYYYGRYETGRFEDDHDNEGISRPSSRDSMHDTYRERGGHERDQRDRRHKERDRYRRPRDSRDMYNPYQGFSYDPYNPYMQQYQYYENLRRTNPQAYAEWYRKYYQQAAAQNSYGAEDRASVHSGRSSANDELAKDRYTRQSYYSQTSLPHLGGYYGGTHTHSVSGQYGLDTSSVSRPFDATDSSMNFEDPNASIQRLTPFKFATAHIKASINSGKFLRILPSYPLDGQNAIVEICNFQSLLANDDEYRELSIFPGPLIKGVTHKKTIIEYCENKINNAVYNSKIGDLEAYVLMWELLILLIRQNGMVVGTDIAELLLKNKPKESMMIRPPSALSNASSAAGENKSETSYHHSSEATNDFAKEDEVTNKFREYLLYGSCQEALEWAMKYGLWGHALFLASKLDKRTYANVMMRFANGLPMNDPLQTLYQLLSGRMPAAVTCISDEKWGDWRPHLAMILSNTTQRPELNCKAITTLGNTLWSRGSLYAAQFCYLMAEVGFGRHDNPETKLVLLGANHQKPFPQFITHEAIHMTEIYEYACSLNDSEFVLPELQTYKYILATRLSDSGLLEKSLSYLEQISSCIVRNPTAFQPSLINNVYILADRLKFYDPVGDAEDESQFGGGIETSRPDNSWLKDLRSVQSDCQNGLLTDRSLNVCTSYEAPVVESESVLLQSYESNAQDAWQQQPQYDQQYQQNVQQSEQVSQLEYEQQSSLQQQSDYANTQYQDQQQFWNQQQQWPSQPNEFTQDNSEQNFGSNAQIEPTEVQKGPSDDVPQISMPNQSKSKSIYEDGAPTPSVPSKKESPVKAKREEKAPEKNSTRWFGGIFSKLVGSSNQMKLPDDKNPTIVWDQDKKKWVNVNEDSNDVASELKPPPKITDMMPKLPQAVPTKDTGNMITNQPELVSSALTNPGQMNSYGADNSTNAMKPPQPNMFKRQGVRNLKKSYVDVFNPSGKPSNGAPMLPNPGAFNSSAQPQMNFFIPQPVNDPNAPTDFLTPAPPLQLDDQSQRRKTNKS